MRHVVTKKLQQLPSSWLLLRLASCAGLLSLTPEEAASTITDIESKC